MTISSRLKTMVLFSATIIALVLLSLLRIGQLHSQDYRHQMQVQKVQQEVDALRSQLWQLQQYQDTDAINGAIRLSQSIAAELAVMQSFGYNLRHEMINNIIKKNDDLNTLLQLYLRHDQDTASMSITSPQGMLHARFNTGIQAIDEELMRYRRLHMDYAAVNQRNLLFIAGTLLVLASLILTLFTFSTLTQFRHSLQSLDSGIDAMADGDLANPVKTYNKDEIGDIVSHFNYMKHMLNQTTIKRDELQKEVERQTRELRNQKEQLRFLAEHDELTQVHSRYAFKQLTEQALVRLECNGGRGALLFVDLDQFKPINDMYGHGVGDIVLRTMAERLQHSVRRSDIVGRYGGDEFVIWLDDLQNEEELTKVIDKILQQLHQAVSIDNLQLLLNLSIGVAWYPRDGKDLESLLEVGDSHMYKAKRSQADDDRPGKIHGLPHPDCQD
ncbi:diguanylate cyclase [Shewanella cyperi]|uniref:Diguanylate cyclase n=1 Tax=Shewanella cyperi TaxID=2814292 RepID=A0A974XNB3_9GAMM|nr:diguanylate cyclase [Shewanella cyperi]QSX31570.1 diguanylate cyclase [Shewanella cyperi]